MANDDNTGWTNTPFRVRVLTDRAAIQAIAADWQALEKRCEGELCFFQSYLWCAAWAESFAGGRNGPRLLIPTIWLGERLVALWPLMSSGQLGVFRKIEALGGAHAQYNTLLLDPAFSADTKAIAGHLLTALARASGPAFDVALFEGVPEGSALARVLPQTASMPSARNSASLLDLSGFGSAEDYIAGLGKLQRRNRNRRRNHLSRHGALRFRVLWPDDADFAPLVRRALQMKRQWLTETGRLGRGVSQPGFSEFLTSLEGDREELKGACLSVLAAGERVAAIEIGFLHARHYYCYLGAFDWDLRGVSPGKVQMEMTVCWLIDNGIATYDLLAHPSAYKDSWSNRIVGLRTYAITRNWKGRLYAHRWVPTIRPVLKRTLESIAYRVRRLAAFGQGLGCLLLVS